MDAKLIKQIGSDLAQIEWFSRVGMPVDEEHEGFTVISDQAEALRKLKSDDWEYVTQEAQAWLTTTLSRDFLEQDRDWNKVVARAKIFYDKKIKSSLDKIKLTQHNSKKILEDCVSWDVVHAFVEQYYTHLCLSGPMFFTQELEVYRSGRIPCGYEFRADIYEAFEKQSGRFLCF